MATVIFYGANEEHGFLSNFYSAPIEVGGGTWPTAEHYYQAQKFSDPNRQQAIREAPTPGVAKKLAWLDSTGLRSDWDAARDGVMLVALRAKFTQHPELHTRLLATGDALLVEHTHLDHYWADGGAGSGRNRLGELLMQVREELREAGGAQGSVATASSYRRSLFRRTLCSYDSCAPQTTHAPRPTLSSRARLAPHAAGGGRGDLGTRETRGAEMHTTQANLYSKTRRIL